MIINGIEARAADSAQVPEASTSTCPRCRGKCCIVCPECGGTGEKRNTSWVVIGACQTCVPGSKGFVTCPRCRGVGVVDTDTLVD